ncbi:MAG: hypothetical protein R3B09_27530 [Nannocystaceae bacterium]
MSSRTLLQALRDAFLACHVWSEDVLSEPDSGSRSGSTALKARGPRLVVRPSCPPGSVGALNEVLFPFFNPERASLSRLCDFIVFYPREEHARMVVLLCELKSTSPRGFVPQLLGGQALAEYLIRAVLLHAKPEIVPTIEYRGVLFSTKAGVRRATGAGRGLDFEPGSLPWIHLRAGEDCQLDALCEPLKQPCLGGLQG